MKLYVLDSGSRGNCYLLKNKEECLVIENGISFSEVKKILNFDTKCIVGNICSHSHSDHYKYTNEYISSGIPTFTPFLEDELNAINKVVKYGGFCIQAFPLLHGIPCYGFYIRHNELGKLIFVTDTAYVRQNFKKLNVNHILCECNYIDGEIDKNSGYYCHKLSHHMGLNTCKDFLAENSTDYLKTVVLLHMGQKDIIKDKCLSDIRIVFSNINIFVADRGLEIDLNLKGDKNE